MHYAVIVAAAKAVKDPWKVNHMHIHTQRMAAASLSYTTSGREKSGSCIENLPPFE